MADVSRKVSLIFDADTSAVENRLRELSNSLKDILNISTKTSGISSIDKNLQEAAKSAALLQTQLKNAVNVKTGNLDLSKFDESLKSSNMSIEKYKQAFSQIGSTGEQTFLQLARAISTADIPLKRSSELLNNFAITMKNTVKWQLSSSLTHGFMSSISSALTYAQHLNKNLTDIRIVSGQSADEMARFAEQANRSARELSTTTNRYTEAALIFYQQGLNDQQVKERTDTVIKMANVTGEAMTDVSSYMTAIWNNFADGTKNLEYYSDVIVKLGADTASSSEEIAGGLEKFIAIGDQIGLSYEYAAAALTTITAQTRQSEDVVGTALRTIFARIQGLNLGETLDDGTTLNKYSSALQKVGVDIKDASGQLKDMDIILDDLGSKWGTLGRDTQIALAQTVGGVRQYNQIIALMDNWDFFQKNLQTAYNAEGSLNKQAEIYAESWEAAQKRVQASAEAIYSSLINDDFFIELNNALSGILDQINVFIQSLGGVEGVLATLSTIFLTVFRDQITASLKNLTYNIINLTTSGKQRLIDMQKSVQQLLVSDTRDYGTLGKAGVADAYASEAKAQLLLIDNTKKLSTQEKAVADILMRQLQLRIDAQIATGEELDTTEKRLENLNSRMSDIYNTNAFKEIFGDSANDLEQLIMKVQTFNSILSSTSQPYEDFNKIINNTSLNTEQQIQGISKIVQSFSNKIGQLGVDQISGAGQTSLNKLNNQIIALQESLAPEKFNIKNIQEQFNGLGNTFVDLATDSEEISNFIVGILQEQVKTQPKTSEGIEKSLKLTKLIKLFTASSEIAGDFGDKLTELGLKTEDTGLVFEALQKHLQQSGNTFISTQQKIVTLANVFSSFAMVITQVQGIIDVWNSDVSLGQKILSTLMVLGTVVPIVMSLNKELALVFPSASSAALGTQLFSKAAASSIPIVSTAGKALDKFWNSFLGPVGKAMIIIGLVVGVIKLLSNALRPEEKETKLEKANRQLEELKTSTDAIKTSTDELRSAWENYSSVQERLAGLKRGTEEWAEAMYEASAASSALMQNELVNAIIQNPELYGTTREQIFNSDGSRNWEAITEAAERYGLTSMMYGNIATAEASQIQVEESNREAALQKIIDMGLSGDLKYIETLQESLSIEGTKTEEVFLGLLDKYFNYLSSNNLINNDENFLGFLDSLSLEDKEVGAILSILLKDTYESFSPEYYQVNDLHGTLTDNALLFAPTSDERRAAYESISGLFYERFLDPQSSYSVYTEEAVNLAKRSYSPYKYNSEASQDFSAYIPLINFKDLGFTEEQLSNMSFNSNVFTSFMGLFLENLLGGNINNQDFFNTLLGDYRSVATDYDILAAITNMGVSFQNEEEKQEFIKQFGEYQGTGEIKVGDTTISEDQIRTMVIRGIAASKTEEERNLAAYTSLGSGEDAEIVRQILSSGDIYKVATPANYLNVIQAALNSGIISQEGYNNLSGDLSLIRELPNIESNIYDNLSYDVIDSLSNLYSTPGYEEYYDLITNIVNKLSEEQAIQFLSSLAETGFTQGYQGVQNINRILDEIGAEGTDLFQVWNQDSQKILTAGYGALSQFVGITGDVIKLAQQLVNGEDLDDSELQQLEALGLDTMKLQTHEGTEYLKEFYTNYINAINEDIAAYESEELEGTIEEDVLPDIDFDLLLSAGPEYIEEVQGILQDLFNDTEEYEFYLEQYIKNLADSYEIELSDSFFEAPTTDWTSSFKELAVGITIADGINGLINNYTELVLSGTAKELLGIKKSGGFLSSENIQALEELKSYYANILGVDPNTITDENLENLISIPGFNSINRAEVGNALDAARSELGLPGLSIFERKKYLDAFISNNLANYEMPEDISSVMDAFVSGDYSNISQRQLDNARKDFFIFEWEKEAQELFLQELGYLNENGELTEAAYRAGFTAREEIISAFAEALNYEVNTDAILASANQFAKNALGRLFDNIEADSIDATEEQLSTLTSLFDEIGSSFEAEVLANIIQDLLDGGQSLDKINQAFSEIDWENITVEELRFALEELGYSADISDNTLWNLINSMQEAIGYTNELTNALNNYSSASSAISSLREDGKVSTDQYETIAELIGYDRAGEYFRLTPEGDYDLEEGISTEGVIGLIRQGLSEDLDQGVKYARNIRNTIGASGLAGSTTSEDFIQRVNSDNLISQYISENQGEIFGRVGINNEELQNNIIEAITKGDSTALDSLLGNTSISALREAVFATAEQDVEEANEAKEGQGRSDWEQDVEDLGLDVEEVDTLGDSIQEKAESSEYLADSLKDDAQAADEVAKELIRYNRGLEAVKDNTDDWAKSLKNNTKGSVDYTNTIDEMTEALEDIYDLDEGSLKGLDLDWDRLNKDMKIMAEGTAEEAAAAYQDGIDAINDAAVLEAGLVPDLDMTQFESGLSDSLVSMNEWQNLVYDALNNIEAGGIIDGPLLSSLESMLNACYSTATEAQNALTRMGVDGQVVVAEEPITNTTPTNDIRASLVDNGYLSVPVVAADGSVSEGPKIPIQGVKYTAVPSVNTSEGAIQNVGFKIVPGTGKTNVTRKAGGRAKSNMGSRPARSGGGGGGGGGGGSRAPRAERKTSTDKDRYRTVKNQLEDLTDSYDKVSTAADRAFGETKLKLLKQQEKAIQDLISKQREYIDEINEYYDIDRKAVEEVSSRLGFAVEFDANGTITNWDEIQDKMIEEYNSHINNKGEVIGMDEEAWSEYEKEWERVMELFNQYDETQDLRKEALQQLQDYANQLYDLQLQEVTYVVEIKIDATDDALEILDYMLGRIEDDAWAAAEAIAFMGQKAAEIQLQNNTYTEGIRGILMNHTRDLVDSEGNIVNSASLTVEDVEGFMSGQEAAIKKIMALNEEFTDEEVQQLREYNSSLIEMNETLNDLRNEVFDKVLDSFEAFNDEMDRSIDKIDHLSSLTENYANIIDIVGQKNLEISNALMESISQATVDQATNRVEATREKMLTIQDEIARAEEALADAKSKGLEEDVKLWEDTLKEMNDSLDEAEEEFLQSWEDALSAATDAFEASMDRAISAFGDALAGPLLGSLEQLEEMFDRQNTIADRYLPDYEKIYELNKLNRDITNSIDETDNIRAKQELAALQEEINKLEEDGVQVSEYQVENLRRRYELKLAELALTESQNAKSEVRMTRNADGDWSYVYVADEEQVAEAEQNYEDKLFAMQQANAEYINNLNDMLIQLRVNTFNSLQEIWEDETLSQEEKIAKTNELFAYAQEQMEYYMDELGLVLGENQILYEQDWTKYSELTGYKISANEDYVDHFNETALSLLTGYETMEEFQQNFNDAIGHPDSGGFLYDLDNAFKTWEANTEEIFNSAGTSMEDFKDVVEDSVNDIVENSEEATESIEEMGDNVVSTFDEITSAVENWSNTYSETIDNILSRNEMLTKSFNELLKAWAGFEDATEIEEGTAPGEDTETGNESDSGETDNGENVAEDGLGTITIRWGRMNIRKEASADSKDLGTVDARGKKLSYVYTKKQGVWVYVPDLGGWVHGNWHDGKYTYLTPFDTGGYTGSWGAEGRVAMLHEKELVLNKQDTSNLLAAVGMIRDISKIIDLNAYASSYGNITSTPNVVDNTGTLEQQVHITAEFPNATDKDEILSAFDDIINLASQYANRR